jgi:hypothetical protein
VFAARGSATGGGPVAYRHRLRTPCVRTSRFVRCFRGSRSAVVDGDAGLGGWTSLGGWPSLPQRSRRRVTSRVGRRFAAPGRLPHQVLLSSLCRCARSKPRPLCSTAKPTVPKKSRPRRSRISPRQPVACPTVYWVRLSAFDASMSPWAVMTFTDDLSRRLPNHAVWPSQGCERKPPSGSTVGWMEHSW